ncbi:MAG: LamG domain-containing protein [Planctomycetota bacterium]
MCKRSCWLISLVLVLVVFNCGRADDKSWVGGGANSWCDDTRWDPAGVPEPGDTAFVGATSPEQGPIIGTLCDANVGGIRGPAYDSASRQQMDITGGSLVVLGNWEWDDLDDKEATGPGVLNISGDAQVEVLGGVRCLDGPGSVTEINISGDPNIYVSGDLRAGDENGSFFELNISGGYTHVGGRLFWGDNGSGDFNMSGGTLIAEGELTMRGRGGADYNINMSGGYVEVRGNLGIPSESEPNAFIHLDGGEIWCRDFINNADANWGMDITYGRIVMDGNEWANVQAMIDANQITAFDGNGVVEVKYDPFAGGPQGETTLKAVTVNEIAYNPSPGHGSAYLCPDVVLSWSPGYFVVDHNVYFGTSESDVNESATPVAIHVDGNSWDPPGELDLGKTYYWRIDGVNDTDGNSPWVGGIWFFTTNDGTAYDPDPGDNTVMVPRDTMLSWSPGCLADTHKVYFSSDFNDVNERDGGALVYSGSNTTCDPDPCDLEYYTEYYWAVDEVGVGGAPTWSGEVWSFRSQSEISDPHLLVWYKFDEDHPRGGIGRDYSGHEAHIGVGQGNWDPNDGVGEPTGCLASDGDYGGEIPDEAFDGVTSAITVAAWVNGDPNQDLDDEGDARPKDMPIFDAGEDSGELLDGDYKVTILIPTADEELAFRAGNDSNDVLVLDKVTPDAWKGDWHHFAFVKDESSGFIGIYFDGFLIDSNGTVDATLSNIVGSSFKIGAYTGHGDDYEGKIDDFRVYDRALSDLEISGLFRGGDLASAWAPNPYDGQPDVDPGVLLKWRPGNYATGHEVYLGTDESDVNDANTTSAGIYRGKFEPNEYDPGGLALDTTYYWRIDEVNEPNNDRWKGKIWEFTTANFVIIDSFESYGSGDNRIYYTWNDGGAVIPMNSSYIDLGVEPFSPANSGEQSMLCIYDNAVNYGAGYYSEVELPFDPCDDWARAGVKVLTLYFYGDPANAAGETEELYAGLKDNTGTYAEARYGDYGGGADINDLKLAEWTEWNVAIPDFTDVDETKITNLYIGLGDRTNTTTPGGYGEVFFDDIRLYQPRCIPELGPRADFSGNCIVDWSDVRIMGGQWLRADLNLATSAPSAAGLVGHWQLDEGMGETTADSSIYTNTGTLEGDYVWTAGRIGSGAVEFTDGRVLVPDNGNTPELRPAAQVSASAWACYSYGQVHNARVVVKGADNAESYSIEIDDSDAVVVQVGDVSGTRFSTSSEDIYKDEWMHLAVTYDSVSLKAYVNGREVASTDEPGVPLSQDTSGLAIGNRSDAMDRELAGAVDDVRVYNYGLSAEEVAYLATEGTGYVPLISEVNLFDDEPQGQKAINIRDLAVLFDSWLASKFWPEE